MGWSPGLDHPAGMALVCRDLLVANRIVSQLIFAGGMAGWRKRLRQFMRRAKHGGSFDRRTESG